MTGSLPPSLTTPTGRQPLMSRKGLQAEAQRRVRAGEPLVHVGQALQIPRSTLTKWAAKGGWRLKDLRREAEGLPPLPRPAYVQRECRSISVRGPCSMAEAPPPPRTLADLKAEIKREGEAAHAAFQAQDLKTAEGHLKTARRLQRLEAGLTAFAPKELTPAEQARNRVYAMSEAELKAEIRRLAGLGGSDNP